MDPKKYPLGASYLRRAGEPIPISLADVDVFTGNSRAYRASYTESLGVLILPYLMEEPGFPVIF